MSLETSQLTANLAGKSWLHTRGAGVMAQERRYITTAEYAEIARTSAATVRYWRHIGYGPQGGKVGRRVLYALPEVLAFLESTQTNSGYVA